MEIKRTTEVFVHTKRRFEIRQSESVEPIVCPRCAEQMLAAEAAAVLFGVSRRTIYKLVEAGAAHFHETADGAAMICLSSLAGILNDDPERLPAAAAEELLETGEKNDIQKFDE